MRRLWLAALIAAMMFTGVSVASSSKPRLRGRVVSIHPHGRWPNSGLDVAAERGGLVDVPLPAFDFRDDFDAANGANGLITNEFAFWNPVDTSAVRSPSWQMTSGSLFWQDGTGWSGRADGCAPDRLSSTCTNSAVFRLNTARADFGDVRVDMALRLNALTSTASTPAVDWDGIHIWLRYQSEIRLYYASVNRRDGTVVIKKKCAGGASNGGTYYTLASVAGHAAPLGTWQSVGASSVTNADGSVTVGLYREGTLVLSTRDTGTGCAPISGAGAVGVRGDNADLNIDAFTVSPL